MEISVLSEDFPQYKVSHQIISKSFNMSSFKLLINYPNPMNVSISKIPDLLYIEVKNEIMLKKTSKIIYLQENSNTSRIIPP